MDDNRTLKARDFLNIELLKAGYYWESGYILTVNAESVDKLKNGVQFWHYPACFGIHIFLTGKQFFF